MLSKYLTFAGLGFIFHYYRCTTFGVVDGVTVQLSKPQHCGSNIWLRLESAIMSQLVATMPTHDL